MKNQRASWEKTDDFAVDSVLSKFCEVVRDHRVQLGLSQEELGCLSGLHRTYLSDIETGQRNNLSMKSLCRLAFALQLTPSELFQEMEAAASSIALGTSQLVGMDS